jgi:4-oxalocrotonate tautomerase
MPHVTVQIYTGKTEAEKQQLADAITNNFIQLFGYGEEAVSVAIVDVEPADWKKKVYEPEIISKEEFLYKKPGYTI